MEQRLSLITLGVQDLERATRFYQALGLKRHEAITDGVAFFQLNGIILSLFPTNELAKDASVNFGQQRTGAIALAYNTRDEKEVDEILAEAKAAGATIVKKARKTSWGGYSGYFTDPEGHLWEVAYNAGFPIDDSGNISLPVM